MISSTTSTEPEHVIYIFYQYQDTEKGSQKEIQIVIELHDFITHQKNVHTE